MITGEQYNEAELQQFAKEFKLNAEVSVATACKQNADSCETATEVVNELGNVNGKRKISTFKKTVKALEGFICLPIYLVVIWRPRQVGLLLTLLKRPDQTLMNSKKQ